MSTEREINTASGLGKTFSVDDINKLSDEQLTQHVASVLDRGLTEVRLKVDLPSDTHGEWVHNDPQSVYEKQLLGFSIDDKYAVKHALHTDGGSGKAVLGDVVHMICPMRLKDAVDRKRAYDYMARHGKKNAGTIKEQTEEREFKAHDHGGVGVEVESTAAEVGLNQITAAVNASNAPKS